MENELIAKFRRKYPKRHILYLNRIDEKYGGEYLELSLDILKNALSKTILDYEVKSDGVYIKNAKKNFLRLFYECAILLEYCPSTNEAILRPYVTATDTMRACCAIIKLFGKNA